MFDRRTYAIASYVIALGVAFLVVTVQVFYDISEGRQVIFCSLLHHCAVAELTTHCLARFRNRLPLPAVGLEEHSECRHGRHVHHSK